MKKYFLPVLWMIIIFTVSSIPGNELPEYPFFGFDKLAHILEYGILGFLWARALKRKFIVRYAPPLAVGHRTIEGWRGELLPSSQSRLDRDEKGELGGVRATRVPPQLILVILIGTVFGILDEIHQLFVPFRVFSVVDMLCDSTGVILGASCQLLLKKSQLARWKRIAT